MTVKVGIICLIARILHIIALRYERLVNLCNLWLKPATDYTDEEGLSPLHPIQLEQRVKQDVRAVGDVFGAGEFARGVADAADAGDEDHADWTKPRHVLCVVTSAGRQQFRR